jgi:hypothetical protein
MEASGELSPPPFSGLRSAPLSSEFVHRSAALTRRTARACAFNSNRPIRDYGFSEPSPSGAQPSTIVFAILAMSSSPAFSGVQLVSAFS